ncbi:MAG TPA: ABC transporter permease [Thermoplasmata archaeon]|nr:ABC transporter permease [Thermoplasmata archaeon]
MTTVEAPPALPSIGAGRAFYRHLDRTFAIVDYEVRKLRHDPTELLLRAVQPALWLVVFGEVFSSLHVIPTGNFSYLQFLAPGILCQSVLFIAIFYGIASIRERELGIAYKFLVSPASRVSLVSGKALSASVRGLSQAVIVYLLAIGLGVHPALAPLNVLGVLFAVVLGSCAFATLSMIIASLVKTQERFLGIGQLMTMPLFFASSAIYPISIMPAWLQPVAYANPLTYLVDAVRPLMIPGEASLFPLWVDFTVLVGVVAVLILVESRLYPRMAQ